VYNIAADSTFKFNTQPDKDTGYRTKSMLTIPLVAASGKTLGVLQIINAQDSHANTIAFDENAELYLNHFAANATIALERASLTRAMILRTIKMAEFRDPKETGAHVNRVASFAVELYDRWAFEKEVPFEIQHKYRDTLRIAAMLHDVGKVGISDSILKKPARFTPEEHDIIKGHAVIGAALFNDIDTDIENMARDVALRHHERWDGTGYPGKIPPEVLENPFTPYQIRQGVSGEEIPLSARIVALADVFDALSSKRVYKDSWKEEDVYEEIRKSSGTHFDPDLVTMFFAILPRIKEIQAMWPD
jgi:HD-GYP domain-containing protein (c-di-GMP phosphodiesterase class II)